MIIESRAYARAGLLGNPSDGYFGKTISIIVRNFGAHVSLYQTPELCIEARDQDLNIFRNMSELVESVNLVGYYGGERLIKATIKKFNEYCAQCGHRLDNKNFTIRFHTSIPRQVGLAGSSAIITATMRALMQFYNVKIPLEIMPNVVLSVETEELGINAGLQDRVIQSYEGCVYMDFDQKIMNKKSHGQYERIDTSLLPMLYIAYKTDLGKISGKVLNDIRSRYEKGDEVVISTLKRIAACAEEGKQALLNRDWSRLGELINENFDLRRKIMNISPSNIELVETARRCGASAKFTGSGGSIIGTYEDDDMLNRLVIELKKIKARVIKPYIS
ncbi:GHMP kinase [candidate division KSB1 bacterium]|nr:GHMP kinase [candidate division KSB1 bacterium]